MFEELDYSKKWPINTMIRETDKLLASVGIKESHGPFHFLLCTKCRGPIWEKLLHLNWKEK